MEDLAQMRKAQRATLTESGPDLPQSGACRWREWVLRHTLGFYHILKYRECVIRSVKISCLKIPFGLLDHRTQNAGSQLRQGF